MRAFFEMRKPTLDRRIEITWIWRVASHPKMRLFLRKVVWDRLLTHVLLRDKGIELLVSCFVYRLEDKSTEYALLHCLRVRMWRIASG